uniref:Integrase catalytic domain-containing protein n=1 Tax=Glossina austeni TaxID=7395 RepID=A0A1A9UPQ2_GLOAU
MRAEETELSTVRKKRGNDSQEQATDTPQKLAHQSTDKNKANPEPQSNLPPTHTNKIAASELQLIHTDTCKPVLFNSQGHAQYFIAFTNDYSRFTDIYFLTQEYDAVEAIKMFMTNVDICRSGQMSQKYIVDYAERFRPVVSYSTIPLLLVLAATNELLANCVGTT